MCNVDISRTIPTTLFLKTKYHKISCKFRAITNLSCVPLNPWLIPRINIKKSNLYCNGFIIKKFIYWSEHTHNRPGWRSKSQYVFQFRHLCTPSISSQSPSTIFYPSCVCIVMKIKGDVPDSCDYVPTDMAELEIDKEDVHDRSKWRRNVNVMKRKSNPIGKLTINR